MKIVVSIVSFNSKDLLRNCLMSIMKRNWKSEVNIYVVDNASPDGSAVMIKKDFPEVNLIENKKNVGFGAAHNQILKKVDADYYLILNPDTSFEGNLIDEMVDFMEDQSQCGISSCKVLGFDNKLQPSAGDLPLGVSLLSWLFNLEALGVKKSFHRNEQEYYKDVHEVGWVSGNFMIIKKEVFEKIGLFDEDYFMYFEDTEICYRAKKAGFIIMINPNVYIKHLSGGSLDDPHFRQWSGEYKGLVLFYGKQFGFLGSLTIKLLVYLSIILRILAFTLNGKFQNSLTYGKIIAKI